jgi:ABC-2 type transport system ATP-binding protein
MAAVIETEGLTKQWGDLVAVSDLTLTVETGECYAFLGRNGSGKRLRLACCSISFGRPVVVHASLAARDPIRRSAGESVTCPVT